MLRMATNTASYKADSSQIRTVAQEFVTFLNKSPSPYHAVHECSLALKASGFSEVKESDVLPTTPLSKFFFTRNKSTLVAVSVGGRYVPGNGFSLVVAHTDSPCLKLKPVSKLASANCLEVGVQCYGGAIWRSWFDRDLGLAGRVIAKVDGQLVHKLVNIAKPILCVPSLAIHLDRDSNDKFVMNKEDHLRPILATKLFDGSDCSEDKKDEEKKTGSFMDDHHKALLNLIACNAGVAAEQIVDMELCCAPTEPAVIGGLYDEFVFGPRLDNLVGTYTAVNGLLQSGDSLQQDTNVRVVICYDNEECGSQSAQGAESGLTEWVLRRLATAANNQSLFEQAIAKSYMISADQAHALHPNYKSKYDEANVAKFHEGIVLKINCNQRYSTTSITAAILKEIAVAANVPLKPFVVRNDSLCGSTVGPIISSNLGLQSVDVGTPQLAMHSIREMACTSGIYYAAKLFKQFFQSYPDVYARLQL